MTDTPHPDFRESRTNYAYGEKRRAWADRIGVMRLLRYKLLVPVLRAKQPPEYVARGVMVGVVSAMTPLVGIQMVIVGGIWAVFDRMMNWKFSLVQGLTWTWITNVFTMIPFYYLFFVTGQFMMGREMSGYEAFAATTRAALETPGNFLEKTWAWCVAMLSEWGTPMVLGCVPWAILFGWLSYQFAMRVMMRRRQRMQRG